MLREGSGGAGSGGGSAISGGFQFIASCAAASRSCFSSAMGGFCWRFFKAKFATFYSKTQLVDVVSKRYPNHDNHDFCYSIDLSQGV